MKVRVFTLRFDDDLGAFDDQALVTFFAAHEGLALSEHLVHVEGAPVLVLVVQYREGTTVRVPGRSLGARPPAPPALPTRDSGSAEPGLDVPPDDRALYDALREWRNQRAQALGRPPYAILKNAQLAACALHRPTTRAALQRIDGIGDGKAEAFGEELLSLIGAFPREPATGAPP
jgi:superfamily II DNA helicase RecQ